MAKRFAGTREPLDQTGRTPETAMPTGPFTSVYQRRSVPSHQTVPADLLADLAGALSRLHARWYVFGAQAVVLWGRPRLTADIDVTVRMDPEDPEGLVRTLETSGFTLRVGNTPEFVRRTRVLPFVHTASGLPLDVVLAGPGLEEQFLSRAVPVTIGSLVVPVISPEDLVATKILAGRPKDIEDVRGILRERLPALDLELIRSTLTLLEEALGQSGLRPILDRELASRRDEQG